LEILEKFGKFGHFWTFLDIFWKFWKIFKILNFKKIPNFFYLKTKFEGWKNWEKFVKT
jgi:hypothetical protein